MTSLPSPPKRHRRRIVVIVAVLLLVSIVSRWYWPRGDARFIGKWAIYDDDTGKFINTVAMDPQGNWREPRYPLHRYWIRGDYLCRSASVSHAWNKHKVLGPHAAFIASVSTMLRIGYVRYEHFEFRGEDELMLYHTLGSHRYRYRLTRIPE